jgi:hypothetical protein
MTDKEVLAAAGDQTRSRSRLDFKRRTDATRKIIHALPSTSPRRVCRALEFHSALRVGSRAGRADQAARAYLKVIAVDPRPYTGPSRRSQPVR